jgi:hypothetical protein
MPLEEKKSNGKKPNITPRKIDWARIALAVFIACFIFTFGILAGYFGRSILESSIISIQDSTKNELLSIETISLLDAQYPCSTSILDTTSGKLNDLGSLISTLEDKQGKNNPDVLEIKKLYNLVEIRHMLLLMDREKNCNQTYNIFLFFYSNKQECKSEVDKWAFILGYIRKNEDTARVYSYDIDLNSELVKVLKDEYKISGCSGVILNEKKLTKSTDNADQVISLMK